MTAIEHAAGAAECHDRAGRRAIGAGSRDRRPVFPDVTIHPPSALSSVRAPAPSSGGGGGVSFEVLARRENVAIGLGPLRSHPLDRAADPYMPPMILFSDTAHGRIAARRRLHLHRAAINLVLDAGNGDRSPAPIDRLRRGWRGSGRVGRRRIALR